MMPSPQQSKIYVIINNTSAYSFAAITKILTFGDFSPKSAL
jgi:hypothetical protein